MSKIKNSSSEERLFEILERLVSFRTITGDTLASHMCLRYAEDILQRSGLHVRKFHSGGFESLIATSRRTKHPKVLLQAHIDVVPAPVEAFAMRQNAGRLEGRGVFDMKYAAACFLLAAEELYDVVEDYDFGIMLTTDEEGTGENGVKYLLDRGYGCDICVLPDGGDNWKLETAAKGGWAFQILVDGTSAHASRPWEGENAIDKLLTFIKHTKKLVPSGNKEGLTMVVSQIAGGQTHNQVPNTANATIDIRYPEEKVGQRVRVHLQKLASEMNVTIKTVTDLPPVRLDPSISLVQAWENTVHEVRGQEPGSYTTSYGASDARFFASKNIPCIVTRPDGGGHHGEDEWVDAQGVYDFYRCIVQYLESSARVSVATGAEMKYTEPKLPETVTELPS